MTPDKRLPLPRSNKTSALPLLPSCCLLVLFIIFAAVPAEAWKLTKFADGQSASWPYNAANPNYINVDFCANTIPNPTPANITAYLTAFSEALEEWQNPGSWFTYNFRVIHDCATIDLGNIPDNTILVAFLDFNLYGPILHVDSKAIAVAKVNVNGSQIKNVAVLFATTRRGGNSVNWVSKAPDPNPSNGYPGYEEDPHRMPPGGSTSVPNSFKSVAVHELGHALGFAHPDSLSGDIVPPGQDPVQRMPSSLTEEYSDGQEEIWSTDLEGLLMRYPHPDPFVSAPLEIKMRNWKYANYGDLPGNLPPQMVAVDANRTALITPFDSVTVKYTVDPQGPSVGAEVGIVAFLSEDDTIDPFDQEIPLDFHQLVTGTPVTNQAFLVPFLNNENEHKIILAAKIGFNRVHQLLSTLKVKRQTTDLTPPYFLTGSVITVSSGTIASGSFTLQWPEAVDLESWINRYHLEATRQGIHHSGEPSNWRIEKDILPGPPGQSMSYGFNGLPPGQWTFKVTPINGGGLQGDPLILQGQVTSPGNRKAYPIFAEFDPVLSGANFNVDEDISVYGTAVGGDFQRFTLEISPSGEENWQSIAVINDPKLEEFLFTFNPDDITPLPWGECLLRLTVYGAQETLTDTIQVSIGLQPGWPVNHASMTNNNFVVADLDEDGAQDIIIPRSGGISAFRPDGSLLKNWVVGSSLSVLGVPAAGDLDNDGRMEVIVEAGGWLHAKTLDGDSLPGWPVRVYSQSGWSVRAPVVSDIDYDGSLEVVFSAHDRLYAFHADGSPVAGWNPVYFDNPNMKAISSPAVADLEGDGPREIFVATYRGLYGFRADGTPLLGWNPFPGIRYDYNSSTDAVDFAPVIGDMDNDGELEIVVGTAHLWRDGTHLYVLSHTPSGGVVEWSTPANINPAPEYNTVSKRYFGSPALMKNPDGRMSALIMGYFDLRGVVTGDFYPNIRCHEIIATGPDSYSAVLRYDNTTEQLLGRPTGESLSPIVTPLGPVGYVLKSFGVYPHYVREDGLRRLNLNAADTYILNSELPSKQGIVWANIDADPNSELVYRKKASGQIVVRELPASISSAGAAFWPMFRHDSGRTGFAGPEPRPPVLTVGGGTTTLQERDSFAIDFYADDPNNGPEPVWDENLTFTATLDGQPLSNFGADFTAGSGRDRPAVAQFHWNTNYATVPDDGSTFKDFTLRVTVNDGRAGSDTKVVNLRVNDVPLITTSIPAETTVVANESSFANLPVNFNSNVLLNSGQSVALQFISVTPPPLNWVLDARWNAGSVGNNLSEVRYLNSSQSAYSLQWEPDFHIAASPTVDPAASPPLTPGTGWAGPFRVTLQASHPQGGTTTIARDIIVIHVNEVPDLQGSTRAISLHPAVGEYSFTIKGTDYDDNFRYQNHSGYITVDCDQVGGVCSLQSVSYGPAPGQAVWRYRWVIPPPEGGELISGRIRVTVRDFEGLTATRQIPIGARGGTPTKYLMGDDLCNPWFPGCPGSPP